MGISVKHRPRHVLRTILFASGFALAALGMGAWALTTAGGSDAVARAERKPAGTAPAAPLADAPRATPVRTGRATPHTDPPRTAKPKAKPKAKHKKKPGYRVVRTGSCQASFYGEGQMTASGERFRPNGLTAAHKTLPMGTRVRVTNKNNGRSVIVRINDRGPYAGGRCLDLSTGAMKRVGGIGSGVIPVRYQVLSRA
ncbi:septal ring lytic transglycosylase RlpA family protein [Actinomadura macrotermitis]|uniref:Probable endolytic peptidoglycan transglycosylase RlpA n=1 Tax=Actinomadura macrotermitis TaxID=2585200 RepID=A0A7K0BWI3_9ACTN|nr:hypothetical protein [Actinomadura macrotermitis]